MAADGIDDIMDLNMYSFGNAYYMTDNATCGPTNVTDYAWGPWSNYNHSYRLCWDEKCGKNTASGPGCFVSGPYCQNGASECAVNLLQMCGKWYNPKFTDYVPFAVCLESKWDLIFASVQKGTAPNMTVINEVITQCVTGTTIDPKKVLDCFDTDVYHNVMKDTAMQTVEHPQTPWVMVTNKTGTAMTFTGDIKDTNFLLQVVCDAWKFNGGSFSLVQSCLGQNDKQILI
eukprot:gnl/MRDRNA2_/MRDRNA2_131849_c0_seq1.p1 gnl/MRDRNA2_/MRDRNA2_131849_c0~~gnl/MRDRNA2_/MRDRNA2_131849_c0_seq1.p1  ORF type:complete len:230 (-),score=42.75 gnl/MRDRNA2_/MRDRNA2_131849_c0_seq1:132-821(-)